jgi:DNA mismatch repair protein MSH2
MVETTVDLDELENHQFIIKPDFDDDLRELKNALDQNREQLNEEHLRVAQDLGMGTDSKVLHFENHQVYGYVFRLTRKVFKPCFSCDSNDFFFSCYSDM